MYKYKVVVFAFRGILREAETASLKKALRIAQDLVLRYGGEGDKEVGDVTVSVFEVVGKCYRSHNESEELTLVAELHGYRVPVAFYSSVDEYNPFRRGVESWGLDHPF